MGAIHRGFLGLDPLIDLVIFSIQEQEFPSSKKLGEEEKSAWNTQQCHEREADSNRLNVLDGEDTKKEEQLHGGVLMNLGLGDVLGEDGLGVEAWLAEPQKNAVPELDSRQRGETHEQEDSVEDRKRDELEDVQGKDGERHEKVGEKHGQTSFLDFEELAVLVLLGETVEVDDAGHSGGDEPWETKHSVDEIEAATQKKIVVVGFSVLQLVALVVDQMPSDSIIEEDQHKGEEGRSGGKENHPTFSVHISQVGKPRASAECFIELFTVLGKACSA